MPGYFLFRFLLFSAIVNYAVLIAWFLAFVFAREWMRKVHGRWFKLPDATFDAIHYGGMDTIGSPLLWLVFAGVVVAALLADLVLMRHGGPHKVGFREAAWWSLGWVALAMAFNAWLWWHAR